MIDKSSKKKPPHRIDLARRAEIAAEKRNRTRALILVAAFRLIGEENGQFHRVEDFCSAAQVSRGTFYKYFAGIANLYTILADELSADFDAAVHRVMDEKVTSAARASAAVRYYLRAAMENSRWGWAMVHTSMGREIFGPDVSARAKATIEEGIASTEFGLSQAEMGKALLLGACLGGTLDILFGRATPSYPEQMAHSILLGLGVKAKLAKSVSQEPLPSLQSLRTDTGASPVNYWAELP